MTAFQIFQTHPNRPQRHLFSVVEYSDRGEKKKKKIYAFHWKWIAFRTSGSSVRYVNNIQWMKLAGSKKKKENVIAKIVKTVNHVYVDRRVIVEETRPNIKFTEMNLPRTIVDACASCARVDREWKKKKTRTRKKTRERERERGRGREENKIRTRRARVKRNEDRRFGVTRAWDGLGSGDSATSSADEEDEETKGARCPGTSAHGFPPEFVRET